MINLPHVDTLQWQSVPSLLWDPVAIADVARRWPVFWLSLCQYSLFTRKQVIPLFLPEAIVYRHNMALCGEDVLVIGFVKWVVLIKKQVKVFACLTEEEALHAILFGFVHNMVESGVPTSDFGIFLKALKNIHSNVQIERIFGRLVEQIG